MNKVVSIQVAGQVLWMNEAAYETLKAYLETIRATLVGHEGAVEIQSDIELRVAELLFETAGEANRVISIERLQEVIAQIGYIDGDLDSELPRRSYLDPTNRILGGVCAGLSTRLGVPAFLLRLLFVALAAIFGLGIALYLVFWISLDPNASRSTSLAARGKAPTAAQLAAYEAPASTSQTRLQKMLFLPVTLIGAIVELVIEHVRKRRAAYAWITRNLMAMGMLGVAATVCASLAEFSGNHFYAAPVVWVLGAAVMYLLVLGIALFLRHVYLAKPRFEIRKSLKVGAVIPVLLLAASAVHLNLAHAVHEEESIERQFALQEPRLNLLLVGSENPDFASGNARIRIKTIRGGDRKLALRIKYAADGLDAGNAKHNLQAIDYAFSFEEGNLRLGQAWKLQDGTHRRGQAVDVLVEVPEGVLVHSSLPLVVERSTRPFQYELFVSPGKPVDYRADEGYFHEAGKAFQGMLSENERAVLEGRFCDDYFISETWRCETNLQQQVSRNARFDRVLEDSAATIEQIRQLLQLERALSRDDLERLNALAHRARSGMHPNDEFERYIEHLMIIKSLPDAAPRRAQE